MSTTLQSSLSRRATVPTGLRRFIEEVGVLLSALLHPREVLKEVEAMRKLYAQASAIEAKDPARAARLRQQAARLGL